MRLSKASSYKITLLVIVLFFTFGVWSLKRNERAPDQDIAKKFLKEEVGETDELSAVMADVKTSLNGEGVSNQSAPFVLHNFKRRSVEGSDLKWEIEATSGTYAADTGDAWLKEANLLLSQADGNLVRVLSQSAKLKFAGNDILKGVFADGLILTQIDKKECSKESSCSNQGRRIEGEKCCKESEETTLKTTSGVYDKERDLFQTADPVTIVRENATISGVGMKAFLEKREFHILSNVTTEIKG
ncbi:MAG TPA: LPS export ABC transporter periplasmic protein LptC [Oligoflexia bacterium]|nr:LPS export ABC transporter periplasmic protein LptC [Oligoflexia bacterium]HMP26377.1 LPS export ABC transporter periplasmic protein LptC [Oligoflexia bacterium]